MPPIFIGSTELTTVGDIKIGGTDVQEVYVGATQVFPTGGSDPTITFTWDPENDEAIPGGTTFTRASIAKYFDGTAFEDVLTGVKRDAHVPSPSAGKGYLAEPEATNNALESSDLTASSIWLAQNASVADDGANVLKLNQSTLTADGSNNFHRVLSFPASVLAETTYFILKEGSERFGIVRQGADNQDYSCFDLNLGTLTENGTNGDGRINSWGNDFYQCETTTSSQDSFTITALSDTGTPGNSDNTFTSSNAILSCHCQAENTNYSTSPIVTTTSELTREADVLDLGVAVTTAFSVLLDVTLPNNVGTGNTVTLLGPDTTAEDILRVDATFNIIMDDGGTPVTIGTSSAGSRIKVSYGRDAGDRSASLDGATAVDGDAPAAGHEGENFELGSRAGINQSRCTHHLTTLFNVKKSDAELEALSS